VSFQNWGGERKENPEAAIPINGRSETLTQFKFSTAYHNRQRGEWHQRVFYRIKKIFQVKNEIKSVNKLKYAL
ncbi:MAG: hypothetical protein ACKO2T_09985, partial [Microcystis aeruginosa]